jgi:hypothetical protein
MKNCIHILYHGGGCKDGFGAAYAAWLRFGDNANYVPVSYGQPVPALKRGKVYIIDFSYPPNVLLQLAGHHQSVTVLDHHFTAQKDLGVDAFIGEGFASKEIIFRPDGFMVVCNLEIKFDMTKSGAVLAWEYFHPDITVPEFFLYLQDRDLWTNNLPQSLEVATALLSYPFEFEVWKKLSGLVTQGQIYELPGILLDALKEEGVACLKFMNSQVDLMAKNCRAVILDGRRNLILFESIDKYVDDFGELMSEQWCCPVSNATVFFSDVGNRLLELYPNAPFSAYYFDRSDGMRQWGLRSRPSFDCSVIAKAFSGGGHKQAAGFSQKI